MKLHYCGIVRPNKIQQNWSLQVASDDHKNTQRFGFDTEHDARNAEKFALYCSLNDLQITEGRDHTDAH